jgi:hypothetical protein
MRRARRQGCGIHGGIQTLVCFTDRQAWKGLNSYHSSKAAALIAFGT